MRKYLKEATMFEDEPRLWYSHFGILTGATLKPYNQPMDLATAILSPYVTDVSDPFGPMTRAEALKEVEKQHNCEAMHG